MSLKSRLLRREINSLKALGYIGVREEASEDAFSSTFLFNDPARTSVHVLCLRSPDEVVSTLACSYKVLRGVRSIVNGNPATLVVKTKRYCRKDNHNGTH